MSQVNRSNTAIFEDKMTFGSEEAFISIKKESYLYEDLDEVIYSKGVYNVDNDYIDRPAYLLRFKNGAVWNSDGYTSVKVAEEGILPIIKPYYEDIQVIEERELE